ncbi:MAG: hypothetical protein ACK56I_01595 [bacterium]
MKRDLPRACSDRGFALCARNSNSLTRLCAHGGYLWCTARRV